MESLGHEAFPDGEWESFSKMFSAEELDFTPQFLGQPSFLLEHDHHEGLNYDPRAPSSFFPTSEATDSLLYSLGNINSNLQYISQERSNGSNCSSSFFLANPSHDNYYFGDAKHIPVANHDVCVMDEKNIGSFFPAFPDIVMGETVCINEEHMSPHEASPEAIANIPGNELLLKRKFDVSECHTKEEDKTNCNQSSENTKKKPRVSRNVQKSKKNVKSKKNQKLSQEEESNAGRDVQSSSGCSSDDDNASQETNGGEPSGSKDSAALNLSGKMRASRGSATDPQSLYARKRRERINERLRILQGLVPNGTKVDISTMLEEAVHYVKFLQLQIKLLSSDDMWMYAPIAYNGMDIGLISQKISPPL